MRGNLLKQYVSLHESLVRERSGLQKRLNDINRVLGGEILVPFAAKRGRRKRGGLSLRDAVLKVISATPLTKGEILQGIQSLGYRFSTKNPMNSLGVILYGKNQKFRNENGRFSLGTRAVLQDTTDGEGRRSLSAEGAQKKGRRRMSAEGRARIAAAARARWAKAKKAGKNRL